MKRALLVLPLVISVFFLTACSAEKQTIFTVNTDNKTINTLLPKIREIFPGLDRYASQFQDIQVQSNYYLTIKFRVPDGANIPKADERVMASGNNCFIEINREGTAVKIGKTGCRLLALDRATPEYTNEHWFSLSASQTGNDQASYRTSQPPSTNAADAPSKPSGLSKFEEMKKAALSGDYQAQRNLAYTLSTGIPHNAILGCAWRIVIVKSGSPQVDQSDTGNKTFFCEKKLNSDELAAAEAQAKKLRAKISGK